MSDDKHPLPALLNVAPLAPALKPSRRHRHSFFFERVGTFGAVPVSADSKQKQCPLQCRWTWSLTEM